MREEWNPSVTTMEKNIAKQPVNNLIKNKREEIRFSQTNIKKDSTGLNTFLTAISIACVTFAGVVIVGLYVI